MELSVPTEPDEPCRANTWTLKRLMSVQKSGASPCSGALVDLRGGNPLLAHVAAHLVD